MRLQLLTPLAMAATSVLAAATIPLLSNIDVWGLVNLDIDGVLRSWSTNSTVLDAAALSPDQIAEFISMRAGTVPAQLTIDETAIFANINGLDVPVSELYNPPADVIPAAQIADAEASRAAHKGVLPLGKRDSIIEARACVPAYCSTGQNYECTIYVGCQACYGSICYGLYGR